MNPETIKISPDLSLPLESVTQTFGVLAMRGMGKTYLASVMAEEMLRTGMPICIIDPLGVFWGLRSSKDGKEPGYPIVIFGGEHADVPLEETAGEFVADLIIRERFPSILDLSLFRKGQQTRFMTDFSERLYHKNREALHMFVDEADAFCPQKPMKGTERLLGAMEDLVRRGRTRGIGMTMITQRAAVINKNILTQISVLVALRTVSPQDRAAIDAWIQVHGTEEEREQLMESLPSLPIGTAWFWSPGWLDLFKKIKVRERTTFDSSATPKIGQKIVAPKSVAEINLSAIKDQMAATIEKHKSEDPKELKKRIRELETQIQQGVDSDLVKNLKQELYVAGQMYSDLHSKLNEIYKVAAGVLNKTEIGPVMAPIKIFSESLSAENKVLMQFPGHVKRVQNFVDNRSSSPVHYKTGEGKTGIALPSGERKILTVLAQYPQHRTKNQIGILTGYAVNGGGFANYLSSLRTKGYIEGRGDALTITREGIQALGDFEPLPTGRELLEYWKGKVGKAERAILEVMGNNPWDSMSKEQVAKQAGYEPSGGGFANALSRLRTLELITGRGEIRLSESLT